MRSFVQHSPKIKLSKSVQQATPPNKYREIFLFLYPLKRIIASPAQGRGTRNAAQSDSRKSAVSEIKPQQRANFRKRFPPPQRALQRLQQELNPLQKAYRRRKLPQERRTI